MFSRYPLGVWAFNYWNLILDIAMAYRLPLEDQTCMNRPFCDYASDSHITWNEPNFHVDRPRKKIIGNPLTWDKWYSKSQSWEGLSCWYLIHLITSWTWYQHYIVQAHFFRCFISLNILFMFNSGMSIVHNNYLSCLIFFSQSSNSNFARDWLDRSFDHLVSLHEYTLSCSKSRPSLTIIIVQSKLRNDLLSLGSKRMGSLNGI